MPETPNARTFHLYPGVRITHEDRDAHGVLFEDETQMLTIRSVSATDEPPLWLVVECGEQGDAAATDNETVTLLIEWGCGWPVNPSPTSGNHGSRYRRQPPVQRTLASPGSWPIIPTVFRAVLGRHWSGAMIAGLLLASVMSWLDPAPSQVLASLAAPFVVLALSSIHEIAHWVMLRVRLRSPTVGALLLRRLNVSVIRPQLSGSDLLAVAAAGPVAGGLASLLGGAAALGCPILLIVCATYFVVNALGLSPLSSDGREIATALQGREGL